MINFLKKNLVPLTLLAVITIIFGTIYSVGQQIMRLGADDPQIQMAEDAAARISKGDTPADVITEKIDPKISLSPFIVVYDLKGQLAASATYAGTELLPNIPYGVLESTTDSYKTVTWEPIPNVRLAAVAVKTHDYYVVSARSLRATESRYGTLMQVIALGWFLSVLTVGSYYYFRKN